MKFVKGISLFFVYPAIMLSLGFLCGVSFMNYFYPGQTGNKNEVQELEMTESDWQKAVIDSISAAEASAAETKEEQTALENGEEGTKISEALEAASIDTKINADTKYVLEETDIYQNTIVETVWKIPEKYIGMTREEFLDAMDQYELSPPLTELERGFVSLEVLSFSQEQVVIQMNYAYTQPSSSFYLMVVDNYLVVYLEDKETVYMYTDILLTELPDNIQQDIINVMFVDDEESLYNFLEAYSS